MLYLFDVDGTLRVPLLLPGGGVLASWDQRILPGRGERLTELRRAGHRLGAASNQGVVAFGLVSLLRAERAMAVLNARLGGALEWIRICPHHPWGLVPRFRIRCRCRKPAPGMLEEALRVFGLSPGETVYVGDRESDRLAAAAAGFRFQWSDAFFG